jgi:hypothetical protein
MKALAILISPKGEEFYSAYGPMTKERKGATEYISQEVAARAAKNTFGRMRTAFWNSERLAEADALRKYRDWTFRVEPAA